MNRYVALFLLLYESHAVCVTVLSTEISLPVFMHFLNYAHIVTEASLMVKRQEFTAQTQQRQVLKVALKSRY